MKDSVGIYSIHHWITHGHEYGGNYATGFELLSEVGYEATGYLWAIISAVIGSLMSIFVGTKFLKRKKG